MFSFQTSTLKFAQSAFHAWRLRGMLLIFTLTGALLLGCSSSPAKAQSGRLSVQQLGDALTSYGKNTVSNNGNTYYTVQCGHGSWKGNVILSLSPNGNFIWMTIDPIQLPSRASAGALATLLKKNQDLGPMFFSINGTWLRLSYPVPNNDMSTAKIKAYLEDLVNTAVSTEPLWDQKTLGGE
jgi:hypothetical protein